MQAILLEESDPDPGAAILRQEELAALQCDRHATTSIHLAVGDDRIEPAVTTFSTAPTPLTSTDVYAASAERINNGGWGGTAN